MISRHTTVCITCAILLAGAVLFFATRSSEGLKGTDDQAVAAVQRLAPGYVPWYRPVDRLLGEQNDTLLFALQAALGAAFIGGYISYTRTRARGRTRKSGAERAH